MFSSHPSLFQQGFARKGAQNKAPSQKEFEQEATEITEKEKKK
jgi:hypothetical protein